MFGGTCRALRVLVIATALIAGALVSAAPASAANRFAEVGGNGPAPCLVSDPCSIETAINSASTVTNDDVTLLGGLPPAPYTTSIALIVPSNVTVHGTIGARPVIQTSATNVPGVELNAGSVFRDVVVDYSGSNRPAIELDGGGTLDRVTSRATGGNADGACGTVNAGAPVIRDSVCWRDGGPTPNPAGGVIARQDSAGVQTLTLRNVTAISSETNDEAGIFATRSTGTLTVNATNVIAFSETGVDVEYRSGFPPNAINLDHSNYDSEGDPSGNLITNPATNFNQTTAPDFVDRLGGDFHQQPTSAGTINTGTATGVLPGELDFDGHDRTIGAAPDIGADELRRPTTTAIACIPTSLTLGAGGSACSATVTDTGSGPTTPTGNVSLATSGSGSFSGGGACALTQVSAGVASCQLTYTPSAVGTGSHQITGSYSGDPSHDASLGAASVGVVPAPTVAPIIPIASFPPPSFDLAAAIKKCKKKFRKGKKRKKCIRRARQRAAA